MVWPRRRILLLVWAVVTVPMLCDQAVAKDSEGPDTDLPPDEAAMFESTNGVNKAVIVKGDMDSLQLGEPVDSEDKPTGVKAPGRGQTLIIVADPRDRTITRLTPFQFLPGYFLFLQYTVGNGAHKPTAVDYDRTGDFIYWTSVNGADSVVARFPYQTGTILGLDGELASEPEGIAVDPISRNLYWTDTGTDRIIVSRLDGSFRKSLITQGLDEPRAIVVDPNSGWMYWTDWGSPPKIERARMDGTERSVIVNIGQGQWPNGLALDAAANRLYWSNGGSGEIWTSGVTGSNPRRIFTHTDRSLFGIAVDETYLYWTATNDPGVHMIRKSLRGYDKIHAAHFKSLHGIVVKTASNTPSQPNACSTSNGNCAQLCLPVPGGGRTCACQDGWSLGSDGRSCHPERTSCQQGHCPWSNVTSASCVDGFCECSFENYERYTCLPVVGSCEIRSGSPAAQAEAFQDSEPRQTYSCVADDNNQYEVHVLGVYEGVGRRSDVRQSNIGAAEINVHVTAGQVSKPLVLVLSSYEAVNWVLHLPEDVEVHKVLLIANDIDQSSVTVRSGSVNNVQRLSARTGGVPACAYGKDDDGCNTVDLLKYIGKEFGPVSSFTGAYRAGGWTLRRIGLAIPCPTLSAPTNGALSSTGATSYQDRVTFTCNTGYVLSGAAVTTCQYNGTWSNAVPTCTPRQCRSLTAPTNGALNSTGANSYQDVVTFTCNTGYQLNGVSSVTCQADGRWSGPVPTCTVPCLTLTAPENGALSPAGATSYLTRVTFTCNRGYERNGASYASCQADGTWSNAVPTCTPRQCRSLTAPTNGALNSTGANSYQDVVTFTCNTGYQLNGVSSVTCQADGRWSGPVPTCTVPCPTLTAPENGALSPAGATSYLNRVTFTCNRGYERIGASYASCQADGTWSNTVPTCTQQCSTLKAPENGTLSPPGPHSYNDVITLTCNPGYARNGAPYTMCQTDGTWSNNIPTCTPTNMAARCRLCMDVLLSALLTAVLVGRWE
ncbi:uncharacterized protein LOC144869249 [Branchiostoma floridae x Branchiostoma japonicum]